MVKQASSARRADETEPVSQLRRAAIEFCVLAMLREKEMYGAELIKELTKPNALLVSAGTVYPVLTRLRHRGYVETSSQESAQGPSRRYHRLTDDGRSALDEFATRWHRFQKAVDQVLAGTGTSQPPCPWLG
jgi:PadR family transcriptional regulator, regulatory protein PadR